jgi:hypothetical protein
MIKKNSYRAVVSGLKGGKIVNFIGGRSGFSKESAFRKARANNRTKAGDHIAVYDSGGHCVNFSCVATTDIRNFQKRFFGKGGK